MTHIRSGLICCSVVMGATCISDSLHAQTASDTSALTEIVVTANKREERLQDVAMSVTALTGEDLNRTQSLDLQQLATLVPGLDLVQGAGAFGPGTRLILRGQNSGGAGATVATVVDDIPFSFSGSQTQGAYLATDLDPYDMSRIEVLRGPQGTLYGASAEGGLIKYVTNSPDSMNFHAGAEVGGMKVAHGGSDASAKGFINVPLVAGIAAARASAYYEELPGWIDNKLAHTSQINSGRRYGGRISISLTPSEDFSARATFFTQTLSKNGGDYVEVNELGSGNPFGRVNGYDYDSYLPADSNSRANVAALNLSYDLHWAKVQSITSYGSLNQNFGIDQPSLAFLVGPGNTIFEKADYHLKKINEELRLVSSPGLTIGGHRTDWQIGAFYTSENVPTLFQYLARSYPSGDPALTALSPDTAELLHAQQATDYSELAGYLDGTYYITSSVDVEAGVRVFHNKQHDQNTQGGVFLGAPISTLPKLTSSETSSTYSVAPRWHLTEDSLLYVRVASGYRPGGPEPFVPGGPASLPSQFTSDKTTDFELGIKSQLAERRLTVDVAAFYIDWSKIQVPVAVPVGPVTYTLQENAGSAVSKGVEWAIDLSVLPGMTLGTSGAYTEAYFAKDAPGLGAKSGERLAYVPKWSGNVHFNLERNAFSDYAAFIGGAWAYTGSRFTDFSTAASISHLPIPSYNLLSLQTGIRNARYTIEIYGNNLTDKVGVTYYNPTGAGASGALGTAAIIRPRTVGLRVSANF